MGSQQKVLVIGLDCATPELIFEEMFDELPNLKKLAQGGVYGEIESSIPAITIPAWMTSVTSKNPGQLGFYGFRNRKGYSYNDIWIANANAVQEPTVWNILSKAGKKVGVVGVPQTYPPKPVNGFMISSFLTPDIESNYTYPAELKEEIKSVVGKYMLDAENFRTEEKDRLLRDIYEMTERRFKLTRHLMKNKAWDFFIMVEMGPDRIHHGFWKFHDKNHKKYVPGSKYENAIRDYYKYLDTEIGKTLELIDDNTAVIVVSDHGAKRMDGSVNINDWFIQNGYLRLLEEPKEIARLKNLKVDWKNTKAWAWGGYVSRLFLNVEGREEQGCVKQEDFEKVRDEVIEKLLEIEDENGRKMNTKVFKPQEIYTGKYIHRAPDLIIYFDDLYWRATEDVGHDAIHSFETEIGPDDAMHAQKGMFIMHKPDGGNGQKLSGLNLIDVAPTVLELMSVPTPDDMEGEVIRG